MARMQFAGEGGGRKATIPAPRQRPPATIPAPRQRPPATIPGPVQRAPAPVYQAPTPAWTPPAPAWNPPPIQWAAPAQNNYAAPAPMQSFAAAPAPAPYSPPPPPPDTRRRIRQDDFLDKSGKRDKELGEIDSTFADQSAAFAAALKKYGLEFDTDVKRQDRDLKTAETGINRNKKIGLTGMSEDFAARGLANSGLFFDANTKGATEYEQQKQRTREARNDNVARLTANKGKFESETTTSRQAARREALARLANRTDLVVE